MKMKIKSSHISTYPVKILKLISDIVSPILSIIIGGKSFNQLIDFLNKHNLLILVNGKSTSLAVMDHLLYVYENVFFGNIGVSIFLDFIKAFDCIEHEVLLGKLFRCGVRGVAYRCFECYLSQRTQYFSINSTKLNTPSRNLWGTPRINFRL